MSYEQALDNYRARATAASRVQHAYHAGAATSDEVRAAEAALHTAGLALNEAEAAYEAETGFDLRAV